MLGTLLDGTQLYFARPDALTSGTLLDTLKYVKPTGFFAVPRIYEKFEERIREKFENASAIKKRISNYNLKLSILGSRYRN